MRDSDERKRDMHYMEGGRRGRSILRGEEARREVDRKWGVSGAGAEEGSSEQEEDRGEVAVGRSRRGVKSGPTVHEQWVNRGTVDEQRESSGRTVVEQWLNSG
jgi:hypothetical protein